MRLFELLGKRFARVLEVGRMLGGVARGWEGLSVGAIADKGDTRISAKGSDVFSLCLFG